MKFKFNRIVPISYRRLKASKRIKIEKANGLHKGSSIAANASLGSGKTIL